MVMALKMMPDGEGRKGQGEQKLHLECWEAEDGTQCRDLQFQDSWQV